MNWYLAVILLSLNLGFHQLPLKCFSSLPAPWVHDWYYFATKSRTNALNHDLADKYVSVLPYNVEVESIFLDPQSSTCIQHEFSA